MLRLFLNISAAFLLCLTFVSGTFAGIQETSPPLEQRQKMTIEAKWGVKFESLRTSANGNLLDFRYRIIDPEKASYLVDRRNKAYLVDQSSGKTLSVPTTAKVGPLRQTVRYGLPKKDKVYFILFGNQHLLKPGAKVNVIIGDFKMENLTVEE